MTPLSVSWKNVVASSTSTGTEISGGTNFFRFVFGPSAGSDWLSQTLTASEATFALSTLFPPEVLNICAVYRPLQLPANLRKKVNGLRVPGVRILRLFILPHKYYSQRPPLLRHQVCPQIQTDVPAQLLKRRFN